MYLFESQLMNNFFPAKLQDLRTLCRVNKTFHKMQWEIFRMAVTHGIMRFLKLEHSFCNRFLGVSMARLQKYGITKNGRRCSCSYMYARISGYDLARLMSIEFKAERAEQWCLVKQKADRRKQKTKLCKQIRLLEKRAVRVAELETHMQKVHSIRINEIDKFPFYMQTLYDKFADRKTKRALEVVGQKLAYLFFLHTCTDYDDQLRQCDELCRYTGFLKYDFNDLFRRQHLQLQPWPWQSDDFPIQIPVKNMQLVWIL